MYDCLLIVGGNASALKRYSMILGIDLFKMPTNVCVHTFKCQNVVSFEGDVKISNDRCFY